MTDREHAINYSKAAKQAKVHRNTIITWINQGLLTHGEIAGHHFVDAQELDALLEVRTRDPRHWQHLWREEQAKQKETPM